MSNRGDGHHNIEGEIQPIYDEGGDRLDNNLELFLDQALQDDMHMDDVRMFVDQGLGIEINGEEMFLGFFRENIGAQIQPNAVEIGNPDNNGDILGDDLNVDNINDQHEEEAGPSAGQGLRVGSNQAVEEDDPSPRGSRKRSREDSGEESDSKRFRWWDIFDTSDSEPYGTDSENSNDDYDAGASPLRNAVTKAETAEDSLPGPAKSGQSAVVETEEDIRQQVEDDDPQPSFSRKRSREENDDDPEERKCKRPRLSDSTSDSDSEAGTAEDSLPGPAKSGQSAVVETEDDIRQQVEDDDPQPSFSRRRSREENDDDTEERKCKRPSPSDSTSDSDT